MELTTLQFIILGIIQGITEWLPISSSGMITLAMSNFYGITDFEFLLKSALILHLGTFFAALIYFRREVVNLVKSLFNYKNSNSETKRTLNFLIISTLVTAIFGFGILQIITSDLTLKITGKIITIFVGILLLITALTQLLVHSRKENTKKILDIKDGKDSFVVGFAQALSVLPGISRSGMTVSTLLLRKFDDTTALKLSFLMSLPVVLLGNIFLNMKDIISLGISSSVLLGILTAFVFGLATIHGLMKISKKINFGWFVLIFAIIILGSLLI